MTCWKPGCDQVAQWGLCLRLFPLGHSILRKDAMCLFTTLDACELHRAPKIADIANIEQLWTKVCNMLRSMGRVEPDFHRAEVYSCPINDPALVGFRNALIKEN